MEAENLPASIEQWYKRATSLDRNWRESRKEEERLRERKKTEGTAPKTGTTTDIAMIPSVAEKATVPSVGDNRACSDGRSRENECGGSKGTRTRCGNSS